MNALLRRRDAKMPTPRCFDAKPKESWGLKPFCSAWPTYALHEEPTSLTSDAIRRALPRFCADFGTEEACARHFLAAPTGPHRQPRPCVWGPEGAAVNGGAGGGAAVCTCAPPDEHYRMCRVGRACLQHRWMCAP